MPANTTYAPTNINEFNKSCLTFSGKSVSFDCEPNETEVCDLEMTDDCLLTGGTLIVKGGNIKDNISLQVVHPTFGVVNEFVSKFGIIEDSQKQFDKQLNYPAKIFAGLKLRVSYESFNSGSTRSIVLNYDLHKVLV
jgi:hypothetical protein